MDTPHFHKHGGKSPFTQVLELGVDSINYCIETIECLTTDQSKAMKIYPKHPTKILSRKSSIFESEGWRGLKVKLARSSNASFISTNGRNGIATSIRKNVLKVFSVMYNVVQPEN